jgi:hypothetical protein
MSVANLGLMRAFDEIARTAGVTYEEVVKSETQKILEAASKNTVAAQVKLIEANERAQPVRVLNGKIYYMKNRYPDALWAQLQAKVRRSIQLSKDARGLAKKSWKQVAERLGLDVAVPGYVSSATTRWGDYPDNAQATEERRNSDFAILIKNGRTYSASVFDAIRKAMNGREKFFKENLKQGIFKNIGTIAAKYPGLNLK